MRMNEKWEWKSEEGRRGGMRKGRGNESKSYHLVGAHVVRVCVAGGRRKVVHEQPKYLLPNSTCICNNTAINQAYTRRESMDKIC